MDVIFDAGDFADLLLVAHVVVDQPHAAVDAIWMAIFDSVTVSMSEEMIGICSSRDSERWVLRFVWRGRTSEVEGRERNIVVGQADCCRKMCRRRWRLRSRVWQVLSWAESTKKIVFSQVGNDGAGVKLSISFRPYRAAFLRPLRTARGEWADREGFVIRVEGEGGIGYGEVAPIPEFGTETVDEAGAFFSAAEWEKPEPGGAGGSALLCLQAEH